MTCSCRALCIVEKTAIILRKWKLVASRVEETVGYRYISGKLLRLEAVREVLMRILFVLSSLVLFSLGCSNGALLSLNQETQEEQASEKEPAKTPNNPGGAGLQNPQGGVWKSFSNIPLPPPRDPIPDMKLHYKRDVDCDGIADWEEVLLGTDPNNRDTDGDGIWDGVEIGRFESPDQECENFFPKNFPPPQTRTNPLRQDTDCDGISDGDEDENKDGRVDPGETDPTNPDSDDDGLLDGTEKGVTPGMILLGGNIVPLTELDPICTARALQRAAVCPAGVQPRETDPLDEDTDGDEIEDGVEDINRNACFEPNLFSTGIGETDPKAADIDSLTLNACHPNNRVKVDIRQNLAAQISMGLPLGFANSYVDIERGNTRGLMGVDAAKNVAFVAWKHTGTPTTTLAALQTLARNHASLLGGTAAMDTFSSWDAPSAQANALIATFQVSGNMSPATRVNNIATTLLGAGIGDLPAAGAPGNTQHIRAQYVLRKNGDVIVVMAVALNNDKVNGSDGYFGLNDVAGSAALASYLDRTRVQCERAMAGRRDVDILLVVDDSGSMTLSKVRLKLLGAALSDYLYNSNLDWRVAVVTTSYHLNIASPGVGITNQGIIRGFTNDRFLLRTWLDTGISGCSTIVACRDNWVKDGKTLCRNTSGFGGGCSVGTAGHDAESVLGAARLALLDMHHPNTPQAQRFRDNADIVVIAITDTEDHVTGLYSSHANKKGYPAWESVGSLVSFFKGQPTTVPGAPTSPLQPVRPGVTIPVHTILSCPKNGACVDHPGDCGAVPLSGPPRLMQAVAGTGGVWAPIDNDATYKANDMVVQNAVKKIMDKAVGSAGVSVKTYKPFIGASLRVAMDNPAGDCRSNPAEANGANVPRSRVHGFDYDGIEQTISFYGNCRPPQNQQSKVAFSYLTWELTPERLPCEDDIRFINDPQEQYCKGNFVCQGDIDMCVCPSLCGNVCDLHIEYCDDITCVCAGGP